MTLQLQIEAGSPEKPVLDQAVNVLRHGGVVAYPTDTLYGLAVDPRRDECVQRLFGLKGRDAARAIPLIAASVEQALDVATFGSDDLRLARAFWPGPLTIVLAARTHLSRALMGVDGTIAVRVPANAIARTLAARFGHAITATSANRSGRTPASTAAEVISAFADEIDLVLDGGPAPGGLPSTIVQAEPGGPRLLRAGAVAWERVLESLK